MVAIMCFAEFTNYTINYSAHASGVVRFVNTITQHVARGDLHCNFRGYANTNLILNHIMHYQLIKMLYCVLIMALMALAHTVAPCHPKHGTAATPCKEFILADNCKGICFGDVQSQEAMVYLQEFLFD